MGFLGSRYSRKEGASGVYGSFRNTEQSYGLVERFSRFGGPSHIAVLKAASSPSYVHREYHTIIVSSSSSSYSGSAPGGELR